MKIRDLDKGRYIVVYDMGKSEYSDGMTVVGKVIELEYNEEGNNTAIIESMPFQRYTVTDDNYFDYWNDYMENKTEYIGIKRQSNDVQQRKRKDMVNSPSHYNQGKIEAIVIIEQIASAYPIKVALSIGNTVKYLIRAPFKNGVEDLKKAAWYLDRAIKKWEDTK
ncbi:DUF3310 domain-containing protein [Staphylococcus arlettae]|uniref:DUF3310 domain-containing protein n=1 Tax=Staphylococcus arlettae TaxID=29378 RepID=UPI003EDED0AB